MIPLDVKKVIWKLITLKVSERTRNPFKHDVTWSYMKLLWLIWALEVSCDKSSCLFNIWPPSSPTTKWWSHPSNPLPMIKNVSICVICEENRNGRVIWLMYVKLWKNSCQKCTNVQFFSFIVDISKDIRADQEKSKRAVRYTSYLTSLIDFSWFGVNRMLKWLVRMEWKSDVKWPNPISSSRSQIWSL